MNSSSEKTDGRLSEYHEHLELIKGVSLFSDFSSQAIKVLTYLFVRGTFDPGVVICEPDEDAGRAYYILSGKISAYRKTGVNKEKLREFGKGDFVGGLALFEAFPSLFYLIAEEQTRYLTLDRQQMLKVMAQFPDLRQLVLKSVLKELLRWEKHSLRSVEGSSLANVGITLL